MISADQLHSIGSLVGCSVLFGVIAIFLRRFIVRSSPVRRRHGNYVLGWMTVGWLIGCVIGVWMIDGKHYRTSEADIGIAGFGLLIGWAIGMVHGLFVIWMRPPQGN